MAGTFDPEAFGFLIFDLYRLIRSDMDQRIAAAGIGITPGEARTLVHAARAGEVRQNVLAERMGLEAMTLSAYLERLERQGLVERLADETDRRAKLIRLTDKSTAVLEAIVSLGKEVRLKARGSMSDEEWEALQQTLKRIRSNFGPPAPEEAAAPAGKLDPIFGNRDA
ncbi:MarR family winged helix-turn-helix transcriptional regulator [Nitratireductor thuwali]|uniref:Transcriptional regulator SlyA n=1 Tax=Nitratireductor thuwali TaxID=2267699 RepID=A0ABY5MHE6_9HYPH|nr:Transcriptional regulator SlyA [Nitratireductor thuwali]